ncbi:MAG TPA: Do family serine endopeptidase [Stellaceae bacterium]|jgi:serine protease Do
MSDARMIRRSPRRRGDAALGAAVSLGLALGAFGCTPLDPGSWAAPSSMGRVKMTSFAPLVREVLPAVVNVSAIERPSKTAADEDATPAGIDPVRTRDTISELPPSALDKLLRRFFNEQHRDEVPQARGLALGSGFIIDPSGYIVTDNHVVENADRVTVTFSDGTERPARIAGRDALTDLALLKVDAPHPLPYLRWGDSDAARVGDWVLAIGNPFGLDDTVSSGIISARGRDIHAGPYDDFLQIDASINRGNSGGPTFDLEGKVIGINSAIYSPNGGSVGIGFAIPANLARPVIDQLKERGRVERGWLGVQIQEVTPEIAQGFGLTKPVGALVTGISTGGPAARAGIAQGDVILSIAGHDISTMRDLPLVVAEMPIGRPADVILWRRNREITLRPMTGEMPRGPETADLGTDENQSGSTESADVGAGLKLAALTPQRRRRLQIPVGISGVAVTAISDESPLAAADLLPGDVIESVDQQSVASPKDVLAKLAAAQAGGGTVVMLIDRQGASHYVALPLRSASAARRNG